MTQQSGTIVATGSQSFMSRRIILCHPFGNANVRQALAAIDSVGLLERFVTTICAESFPLSDLLPSGMRLELEKRSYTCISKKKIVCRPGLELIRLLSARLGQRFPVLKSVSPSVDSIWRTIDWSVISVAASLSESDLALYCYEDGAYEAFSVLKRSIKFYELPIGYWRRMHSLFLEEKSLRPAWASTLVGLSDSEEKLERKDAELELADRIVVPSEFVKSTLPLRFARSAAVIPYGCPIPIEPRILQAKRSGKLKVIFCGSLGQRKGVAYLFEAMARVKDIAQLTVVGNFVAPSEPLQRALLNVTWHRMLPRQRLLELMQEHDVFLFPTLFEGRALVVLEALSQGLPVITTENSGTGDLITDGETGFMVPIRDVDAIVQAIVMLHKDRDLLMYMHERVIRAAERSSWACYRENLIEMVTSISGNL